jgi:hypothetical protein
VIRTAVGRGAAQEVGDRRHRYAELLEDRRGRHERIGDDDASEPAQLFGMPQGTQAA